MNCKDCMFWQQGDYHDEKNLYGFCHRYPPKTSAKDPMRSEWPAVFEVDYCGEFRGRERQFT